MIYLSGFYTKRLLNDWAIWVFCLFILALFTLLLFSGKGAYDSTPQLTFIWVVRAVRRVDAILLIAAIFFSSELYRLESKDDAEHILHTFPVSSNSMLLGKILAMGFVLLLVVLLMAAVGMVAQYAYAMPIDLAAYALEFLTGLFRNVVFYIVLAFLLQVVIQQRYVALGLAIGLLFVQSVFEQIGLDHPILYPLKVNAGLYSDFVGFGPFLERHFWYSLYILSIMVGMLFLLDKFYVRGVDFWWKLRLLKLKRRLSDRKWGLLALVCMLGVVVYLIVSNSGPFYSKNYLSRLRAGYEVELGYIKDKQQPLLAKFDLDLDYTGDQNIIAMGKYRLVNESDRQMDTLYVQKPWLHPHQKYPIAHDVVVSRLAFDRANRKIEGFEQYQHEVYVLDEALMPGDSLTMVFRVDMGNDFMASKLVNTDLAGNGSIIGRGYFPVLGYDNGYEMSPENLRRQFGLGPKKQMSKIDDSLAYQVGVNGAHSISLATAIKSEQMGVTLGACSFDGDHVNYHMGAPMENQFVFVNGSYDVLSDSVRLDGRCIPLDIYHHPLHHENAPRIMNAMKKSLLCYDREFGAYEFDHLRLAEFPGYQLMAMSLAGTIVYSENMGFTTDVAATGYDLPFWVTAHEVAHNWWGEKVRGADVQGNGFIVETLAQYSAAMVFEKEYGEVALRKVRDYEYERYFDGIKAETQQEKPLYLVEDQPYIHYGKGLLNMYTLKHFITADSVNKALQRITAKYPGKDRRYLNGIQLMDEFKLVTPDSLQYLIDDLFGKIVLYDLRAVKAEAIAQAQGYETNVELVVNKYELDANGQYQPVKNKEWVEVGLYDEHDSLIYKGVHRCVRFGEGEFVKIHTQTRPAKVVVDPDMVYLDRNLNNNVIFNY